jgi:hypothetical protein
VSDVPIEQREFGVFWGDGLLNCNITYEPLIDKIINCRDIMCIKAVKKTGKSVLLQQLAFNLTTGKPFLDIYHIHKPCKVLYIQAEDFRTNMVKRFHNMKKCVEWDKNNFYHCVIAGTALHTEDGFQKLMELISIPKANYDVIIYDPLYALMNGGNMLDAKDATLWTNNVRRMLAYYKATGIVVHHDSEKSYTDKNGGKHKASEANVFGSTVWGGFFTHAFVLQAHKGIHYLKCVFQRSGEMLDKLEMKMIKPQNDPERRLMFSAGPEDVQSKESALKALLHTQKQVPYPEVYQILDMSTTHFHRLVAKFIKTGEVAKKIDDTGKIWYRLTTDKPL